MKRHPPRTVYPLIVHLTIYDNVKSDASQKKRKKSVLKKAHILSPFENNYSSNNTIYMCSVHFVNFSNLQVTANPRWMKKNQLQKCEGQQAVTWCCVTKTIIYFVTFITVLTLHIFTLDHFLGTAFKRCGCATSPDKGCALIGLRYSIWVPSEGKSNRIVEWFDLDVSITISEWTGRCILLHTIQC